jgi:hypothetical protein
LTECQKSTCKPIPLTVKIDMNAAIRKLLIEQGSHFSCMACLFTLPVRFRSIDERYCTDCYQVIHEKDVNGVDEANTGLYAKIPGSNPLVPVKRGRGRPRKELPVNVIETGKTQMECARAAGVSQSTISRRRAAARLMLPLMSDRDHTEPYTE